MPKTERCNPNWEAERDFANRPLPRPSLADRLTWALRLALWRVRMLSPARRRAAKGLAAQASTRAALLRAALLNSIGGSDAED